MDTNILFLNLIIIVVGLFVLWQGGQILFMRNKTASTKARVVDTKTLERRKTAYRNSNWALLSYKVNGKAILSKNRIQVPMNTRIGEIIEIWYYKDNPAKIAQFSTKRFLIGLGVLMIFILARLAQIN